MLFAFCFLLLSSSAFSQPKPDFLAVDSAFVSAQYEQAELLALRILQGPFDLTADERAKLNLTMGYSALMLGRENDARAYFARALDAVPSLELDPVQVSPKFRVVFDDVKASRKTAREREEVVLSQTRSIRVARLANIFVPGSGQWLEGHPWRGALMFTAQAASVAAFVLQAGKLDESRENYLSQTDRSLVQRDYDRYNRDYRLAWATGALTGLVYLASQADLIWLRPQLKGTKVAILPVPSGAALAISW